mmetsp:Transcript_20964/g.73960  ORF Transcript_20964/g.73960 Transcript_20964/m.73960 type:complete len:594 (-) Transcript_20964:291-2072(-)|eukprot:CAMPEP_0203814728 /NCGR_PEP_ID=MMETSP0115-20131106/5444_1 /ASSEMBLY_ACC=CAM_ASM_000227 /TAXON_ID=33651 /ORGANISM="Bicosoecid sp, Strain ms1" /LENGTH=593 /DNA_ID=CAMNT_0050723611 /DNA_START=329 /DNA_END=2110 /DNA_ORIENTATION=+
MASADTSSGDAGPLVAARGGAGGGSSAEGGEALLRARIVSWNVGLRGLRALVRDVYGGSLARMLDELGADILCLQETKLTRQTLSEDLVVVPGYTCYHSLNRQGLAYCGVATYCRRSLTPCRAEDGFTGSLVKGTSEQRILPYAEAPASVDLRALDLEGRCVVTDHRDFVLLNVYFPAGGGGDPKRWEYKMRVHEAVTMRVRALMRAGRRVVIAGDFNVAHRPIDHCQPDEWLKHTGLAFEAAPHRAWLSGLLATLPDASSAVTVGESELAPSDSGLVAADPASRADVEFWRRLEGASSAKADAHRSRRRGAALVDSFRHFYPLRRFAYSHWDQASGRRETNFGKRIDYVVVDSELVERDRLLAAGIASEVKGSDHAPVWTDLMVTEAPTGALPPANLCAELSPEFAVRQQQLDAFVARKSGGDAFRDDAAVGAPSDPSVDATKSMASASERYPISSGAKRRRKEGGETQPSLKSFFGGAGGARSTTVARHSEPDPRSALQLLRHKTPSAPKQPSAEWKALLGGPVPPPLCLHGEVCVEYKVKKDGPNCGRAFFTCKRPEGPKSDPNSRCRTFVWVDEVRAQLVKSRRPGGPR